MKFTSTTKFSSNRSFGLLFFVVFLIISLWPLNYEEDLRLWALFLSLIFLILGLLNSKLLTPLNKLWLRFGIILGAFISPIIMGLVFFVVVTPTGIIMRFFGKDSLRLKMSKNIDSYWLNREKTKSTMKNQF